MVRDGQVEKIERAMQEVSRRGNQEVLDQDVYKERIFVIIVHTEKK